MGRGRTVQKGLSFYRMDSGHILNKKVRLLYNEYGSDGYYIWSCLLDKAYSDWGYYFDMNDLEEMELFASEYCKKPLTLIQEVITGCIRRGLFEKTVADLFGILTSTMMQETFLVATSDRRSKGTIFQMVKDWVLLDLSQEVPPNISIVPPKISNVPGNNSNTPRKNTQRREEKRRIEKIREENTAPIGDGGPAAAPPPDLKLVFKGIEKTKKGLYDFIRDYRPDFPEPYIELWNQFAAERSKPKVSKLSDARRKKFSTRIHEKTFDFLAILTKAGKAGDFLSTSKWFTWDWIMESEGNYLKVIEGNYDPGEKKTAAGAEPATSAQKGPPGLSKVQQEVNYLYGRYLEGQVTIISVDWGHFNEIVRAELVIPTAEEVERLRKVAKTYMAEKSIEDREEDVTRFAKRFGVLEFFERLKIKGQETVFYEQPEKV